MSEHVGEPEVIDTGINVKFDKGEVTVDAEPVEPLKRPEEADITDTQKAETPLSVQQRLAAARAARRETGSLAGEESRRQGWSAEREDEPIEQSKPEESFAPDAAGAAGTYETTNEPVVAEQDFSPSLAYKAKEKASKIMEGTKSRYDAYATWRDEPYLKQDKERIERDNPWIKPAEALELSNAGAVKGLVDGYKKAEAGGNLDAWIQQQAWQHAILEDVGVSKAATPEEIKQEFDAKIEKYKDHISNLVEVAESIPGVEEGDASDFTAALAEYAETVGKYDTAKEKLDKLTGLQAKIAAGAGAVRDVVQKVTSYPYAAGIWLHNKINKTEPTVESRRLMRAGSYLVSLGTLGLALSRAKAGLGGLEDINLDFMSSGADGHNYVEAPSVQPSANAGNEYNTVPTEVAPSPAATPEPEMQTAVQPPAETEPTVPPPVSETLSIKKGDDWYGISEDLLHEYLRDDKGKKIPLDMGKRQEVIDALRDANPTGLKPGSKIDISTALSTIENLKEDVKFAYDDIASNTSLYKVQRGDTIPEIADRLIDAHGGDKRLKSDVVKALIDSNVTYNGSKHWIDEGQILNLEDAQQVISDNLEALTAQEANIEAPTDTSEADTQPTEEQSSAQTESSPETPAPSQSTSPAPESLVAQPTVEQSSSGENFRISSSANSALRELGVPVKDWEDVIRMTSSFLVGAGLAKVLIDGNVIFKRNSFGLLPTETKRTLREAAIKLGRR